MTDREKLVGLIVEIENEMIKAYPYTTDQFRIEKTVDHLLANGVTVQNWRDAKTDPPKSGEHVLLCCEVRRSDGSSVKRYVCDGFYAAKHTETVFYNGDDIACEYREETDEYYLCEGWYEIIKNRGDYDTIIVSDSVVGWMPLPEPMKELKMDGGGV